MADALLKVYRGTLSTTLGTSLYTVPSATTVVVRSIVITNSTATNIAVTLRLAGIDLLSATSVQANGVLALDVNQVMAATEIVAGGASAPGCTAHISGVAVT